MTHFFASLVAALLMGAPTEVREGSSPQLAVDTRGTIRMVFGRRDTIFVATSRDNGETFGAAVIVGVVPKMHLGNTRGPTIASSKTRSVIIAPDQAGDIAMFQLDHATDRWTKLADTLNDAAGSAPEGLATVAANGAAGFQAVWLDLRKGRQNQVYLGVVPVNGAKRVPNRELYASPDGHVCECCRPSITVSGRVVGVMFRNWLGGARDMYSTVSTNGGRRFDAPRKLGSGTWRLDACPMDGGGIIVDARGGLASVWRREASVFYAEAGGLEQLVGEGRSPMIARSGNSMYVAWQDGPSVKLKTMGSAADPVVVGEGRLPHVLALRAGGALVAWEKGGTVYYRKM